MKIQELAIIFIIIILPISLLLSEYTQFQIQTIKVQTEYDARLTSATYDAIRAFQLNATNSSTSDLANSKMRDLEASVNSFRNSIMAGFELNGYTEDELNNYIPALVYTLYDGFYIYSPYENINYRYETDDAGNILYDKPIDDNGENLYGLKPYISYSCRYQATGIDVVITYALDNYVTVQGKIGNDYINKSGYLIDNIQVDEDTDTVKYNGVEIGTEHLKENILGQEYSYVKVNGIKYYLREEYFKYEDEEGNEKNLDCIVYLLNGTPVIQCKEDKENEENNKKFLYWKTLIENNNAAKEYYKDAYEFTTWFNSTNLKNLKYKDAIDEVILDDGSTEITNLWAENETLIFDFNTSNTDYSNNIENQLSNYNQHRLAVIRHKIETNLAIAISNYNSYSGVLNVFQMPELKEDEWDHITHNISLISFLQGLPIGGKIYNGYSIVTNSESKEVVLEENIYILAEDSTNGKCSYHKIGDKGFETGGTLTISAHEYTEGYGEKQSAGRLNLDFKRTILNDESNSVSYYYYPLKRYNASYDSIVMQSNVTTYDDIYEYINEQNNDLKIAFYTALGRERYGMYKGNSTDSWSAMGNDSNAEETVTTYTVTYDANGGIGAPEAQTVAVGESLEIPNIIPTLSGHTFKGWSNNPMATTGMYNTGDTITIEEDTTLYAIWNIETYTVTYDGNGTTISIENDTKIHGIDLILNTEEPTRTGYNFVEWNTKSDGTGISYQPGGIYSIDANMTLYAIWEEKILAQYTITLYSNNGTFLDGDVGGTSISQTVNEGEFVKIPTANIPEREGYTFGGYALENDATEGTIFPDYQIKIEKNQEYYAVWTYDGGIQTNVTVRLLANGGKFPSEQIYLQSTNAKGTGLKLSATSTTTPTREGYTFLGWGNMATNPSEMYEIGTTVQITEDMTFYAIWKEDE